MHHRKSQGFTLIELMITVAIVAILASIAYPSYTGYVIRSNRTAAQAQMMDIANRQQQFLLANRSYATKDVLTTSGYSLPAELAPRYDYSITFISGAVPNFTVVFTPKGVQATNSEPVLKLTSEGVKDPIGKW